VFSFLLKLMVAKRAVMNTNTVVCFGEMLWDVLLTGAKPGGAPMNVAYHLQKLGLPTAVISRVGADERGERLIDLLKKNGITTDYVQVDPIHQTGVVLAQLNERAEASYDIVRPVAWDFIEVHEDLKKLVAESRYFVFGSLAARSTTSANTMFQLLEVANTKVLDINLRAPHFTKAMVEELLQHCDALKINDQELPLIAGWYGAFKTQEEAMALLQDRFRIETIVTTCGANGALLIRNGVLYSHPGFKINVRDTIGSGDAFLAALLYKIHNGTPAAEALEFANGLGAFIASCEGACPSYEIAAVEHQVQAHFV
jgi:fructokinase